MQIPKRCTQYALYFAMSALLMLFDSLLPVYGETIVFGPEQFDRGRAKPRPEVRHFSIWNPDDDFTLIVQNGDGEDESTRVSSAIITINGIQILGPEDFSKQVDLIEIPVSLADGNEIVVENIEIRGEPGSFLIVSIFGTNTAPIANAGKDNSALTGVSFSLDGSKSFDPDGDAITFGWSAVGAPPGSTATLQDTASIKPSFIPDQPGDYVFELVVNDGEVDSTPDQVTVTAVADIAPPNADAGEDQNALIGIPVLLDGSNSQDPNGFLLSFTWIFESLPPESALTDADIVFANTPAPQFTPDTVGNYVLRLDVGNGASNDTDRVQIIASESNVPPNADAGPDIAVRTSQAAKLDGSGSTDPDQGPLPLADSWSLIGRPDGSTLTSADLIPSDQAITTLIPDVEGDYLARLKVDDGEASDEDNVLIFGDNTAPDIGFLSPVEGSTVTSMPEIRVFFSDDGSGLDLSSYQTTINGIDVTSGTFVSPYGASYTPAAPLPVGENEATAQIADLAGNVQTTMITFTVGGFAAIADCAPTSGEVPLAVRFRSRGEFDGGSIVLYRWDFQGDGVFDTVDSVAKDYSFTFNTQGTFNAVLEVTNNFGDTATDTCTIQVGGNAPIAIANASPSNGPVPLDVNLTCTGSDADGTIVLYEWDFDGDGSFDYSNPSSGSVMHTYSQEGTFVALCRVTDNDGLTGEARTTTTLIRPAPPGSPSVTATASPSSGSAPLAVSFNGSAVDDGSIVLWEWDFDGDGLFDYSSPSSPATSFTYVNAGIFAAALRATDDEGKTGIDTTEVIVNLTANLSIPDNTFDPSLGESGVINTSLTAGVPVRILLKDQEGQLVRTLVNEFRAAGNYQDPWDGRSDDGNLLPEAPYYAVLEYDFGPEVRRVDWTNTSGGVRYNPSRNSLPRTFSPFEDDLLDINFTIPANRGASEILAFIGLFFTDTRFITLLNRIPLGAGTHTIHWDGLDASGNFAVAPPGDFFLFGIFGFTLPDNAIFLQAAPVISNMQVDPNFFDPATPDFLTPNAPVATVTYDLDKTATVELTVTNLKTGQVLKRITQQAVAAGTGHTIAWNGHAENGLFADAGDYRISLRATDSTSSESITRYALVRVFY